MSRKISVSQLKPGMYVSDLGADWLTHSFLFNSFAVTDEAQIQRIAAAGIRELYIDPARGLDVVDAPTDAEVLARVEAEMMEVARHAPPVHRYTASEEMCPAPGRFRGRQPASSVRP